MIFRRLIATVWQLRWPLLATHIAVVVLTLSIVAPFLTATVSAAVSLSGKTGLADYEIAGFLLSPLGFAVGLVAAALILAAAVLETAVMMAVIAFDQRGEGRSVRSAIDMAVLRLPSVVRFAGWFILRILVVVLPLAGLIALVGLPLIGAHDINYYLSVRPPEFQRFLWMALGIGAVGAGILIYLLLGWSMALPGVLFGAYTPRGAFASSAQVVRGKRLPLLGLFAGWTLLALVVSGTVSALVVLSADVLGDWAGGDLGRSAKVAIFVLLIWGVLIALVTTVTRGGFAALLVDRAVFLGVPLDKYRAAPPTPRSRLVGAAVLVAVVAMGGLALSSGLMNRLEADHDVYIVAHRGAAGTRPENTLSAMEKAIEDGAEWLELDVQETAEGEVIVAHDSDFMKIAAVPTKVWDITADELAGIDAGGWFAPEFANEPVPRLAEVLALAKDRAKVLIELKYYGHDQMLEQRVVDLVEDAGMADQIAIMSLKPEGVAKMRALRPDWQVGLLAATSLGDLTGRDVDFLAVNSGVATAGFLARARDVGMPVLVWTVNTPEDMSRMISRGVDGLITDFPDIVPKVQAARAELTPVERLWLDLGSAIGVLPPQAKASSDEDA